MMAAPPSTARIWPVILAASGLRKKCGGIGDSLAVLDRSPGDGAGLCPDVPDMFKVRNLARRCCGDRSGGDGIDANPITAMTTGEGADQGFQGRLVDAHPVILRIDMVGVK